MDRVPSHPAAEAAAVSALREDLLRFVYRQRAAGLGDLDEIWAAPLPTRVAAGDAVEGVRLTERLAETRFAVTVPRNASRFRPGDRLRVGDGADPFREVEAELLEDLGDGRLVLGLPYRGDLAALSGALEAGPVVLDRGEVDLAELTIRGIDRMWEASSRGCRALREVLDGTRPAAVDERRSALADESVERLTEHGIDLDPSQRAAFRAAWAAQPVQLVQGPPGTGKTWLLGLLAAALAWRGARLLITAATHRAVDNALEQVAAVARHFERPLPLVRINARRDAGWRLERAGVTLVRGARRLELPPTGGVAVGATVLTAAGIGEDRFHLGLMDEAAQVPLSQAPCALPCAPRWALFGDDRQLGPVVAADAAADPAAVSVFEHLREASEPHLLDRTHRLNAELCRFPSVAFYGGRLAPSPSAAGRSFPARPGGRWDELLAPAPAAILAALPHEGYRTHAPPESRLVAELVQELLEHHELPPDELAVITPFRRQAQEILRELQRRLGGEADLPLVDTVERIQGQEREAVIISLTCSDPSALRRDARFFFSPRRLCVALTRARSKLVVVGSPHLIDTLPRSHAALIDFSRFCGLFRELPRVDLSSLLSD